MTAAERLRASWRRLRLDLGRVVAGQDLTEPRPVADAVLDALDAEPIIEGAIASAVRLTVEAPELAGAISRLVSGPIILGVEELHASRRDVVVEVVELAATTAVAEYLQRVAAVVRLETDLQR